ncbi:MAG: hypothetical protein IPL83_04280 [Bdellovibrionales bacterium]|nr:hypothetical protein [Bdellovibrionales bacterium]
MKSFALCFLFSWLFLFQNSMVHAEQSMIRWGGFWTLSVNQSDSDVLYGGYLNDKLNLYNDSKAGLNGTISIDETWTATLQLVARGTGGDRSFEPELDWALATWEPSSIYSLRLGKQKLPAWLISDHLDVGVLYPWNRPPNEVYDTNPLSSFVGMSHSFSFTLPKSTNLQIELVGGGANSDLRRDKDTTFELDARDIVGSTLTIKRNELSFRVAYFQAHVDASIVANKDTLLGLPAPYDTLSARTTSVTPLNLGRATFSNMGFRWDGERVLALGEYVQQKNSVSDLEKIAAYYATLGYYWGGKKSILTHLTYSAESELEATNPFIKNGKQTSKILGLNYIVSPSLVAKAQWTQTESEKGKRGSFASDPGRPVNLVDISLNSAF